MGFRNNLKSRLIKKGWGEAIELFNCFEKHCPKEFEEWKKSGDTILLRDSCEKFRNWAIYNSRTGNLPFENDVYAIDACMAQMEHEKKGQNHE